MNLSPRRGFLFWYVLGVLGLVYSLLAAGLPWLAQAVAEKGAPAAPVPGTILLWYMILAAAGAVLHVTMSDRHWEDFARPLRSPLLGVPLLVLVAAAVGLHVFRVLAPTPASPTGLRLQHPPMPAEYEALRNPNRGAAPAERAARLEEGRVLYQVNCRPCHGTKADGRGPMHRAFSLRPIDFTAPDTLVQLTEPAALWRVKKGGPGLPANATPWDSAMPAWEKDLKEDEIWKILLAEYEIAGKEPREMGEK